MVWKVAARDAAVVAAATLVWWIAAERSAATGPVADTLGVVAGVLVGAVGFVLHEWGHLLAGLAAGGRFPVTGDLRSPFLFGVDPSNGVREFTIMSLGGFAVTAGMIGFVYVVLPDAYLATRVARGIVMFLATLTVVLEVPLLLFTIAAGSIPQVASVASGEEEG